MKSRVPRVIERIRKPRINRLSAACGMMAVALPAITVPLLPPAAPPEISVTACETVITTPGAKVSLDANLDCPGSVFGIRIGVDDVTLDLNGYIITGDHTVNQRGIAVSGNNPLKVTINGPGVVQGFFTGVYLGPGDRHNVKDASSTA